MKVSFSFTVFCLAVFFLGVKADIPADLVTTLDGYTNLTAAPFKLYSGMLNISDSKSNKSIHYVFQTAMANASTSPLILWLNGGPGCSSLGGWLSEIGPYQMYADANVTDRTNTTWNNLANILYIEAPVGVGFSNGNTTYNDTVTAQDMYAAVQKFFANFTEFKTNPFYISGESYAGVYVPNLAMTILKDTATQVNLKGILVGNPVTNRSYLESGLPAVQFMYNHYLVPLDAYMGVQNNCQGDQSDPICQFYQNMISQLTSKINPYGIYNYCYYSASDPASGYQKRVNKIRGSWHHYDSDSPCVTNYGAYLFLNNATVQQNLHVPNLTWNDCSDVVFHSYQANPNGSLDAYAYLLSQNKINIWVYSGDTDAVVPFTDTLYWIKNMNLTITEPWRAWMVDDQIGGFTQGYQGLRFVSIVGAGHMVPTDKPASAFAMVKAFLNGTLPTPPSAKPTMSSI